MNFLRLLPVVISLLLLGAHFLRAGQTSLVVVSLVLLIPLFFRKSWVPRLIQLVLLLGHCLLLYPDWYSGAGR
jgi:hypothetical protein